MIVVARYTNFVAPRFIHKSKRNHEVNLLDRMLFLQSQGLMKISLHKAVQAEIYSILRVGRIRVKGPVGKRIAKEFPHHVIMHFVHKYFDLFDIEYMDSLKSINFTDKETYKNSLSQEIEYHLV